MHIQARSGTTGAAFTDDDADDLLVNTSYGNGGLVQILAILEEHGFNLRAASGRMIELDGIFAWRVAQRFDDNGQAIDIDDDDATLKAAEIVNGAGFDTRAFEVEHETLTDEPGALRAFIEHINERGGMVEELSVGTPDEDGRIPVQAWVSRLSLA